MTGLILFSAISPLIDIYVTHKYYSLNAQTASLVGSVSDSLAKQISYDSSKDAYVFNAAGMTESTQTVGPDKVPLSLLQAKVGGGNDKSKSLYAVAMPTDSKQGVTYYDSNTGLSFQIVPNFTQMSAKEIDNHVVYPINSDLQMVYSVKNNGLKEDIVLKQSVGDSFSYSYSLKLPQTLEARMLTDGSNSLGIYSADPALFTHSTYGADYDPAKIESAQLHAAKDHLVFAIPAPVIKQAGQSSQGSANASFALSNDGLTLTVSANHLTGLHYPVSVDPTVVITSTSDFSIGNNEDNNITYPANQINRGSVTGGTISGGWTPTSLLTTSNRDTSSAVYNGYAYEVGGYSGSGFVVTVLYALINSSNGSIGTWASTTPLLAATAKGQTVAYNGYLYYVGGFNGTAAVNTVYYALINSNGTVGTWNTTTVLTAATEYAGAVAYNGYLYSIGGDNGTLAAAVYYAPINADGTIGAWTITTPLSVATNMATSVVYNGYLYEIGGNTGSATANVYYAPINASGTIGSWITTTVLPVATYVATSVVYNGYVYEIGGYNGSSYFATVYYAPINANGTIGAWTTSVSIPAATDVAGSIAYNGYIYEIGGWNGTTTFTTVEYAKIDPAGMTTTWSTSGNTALTVATKEGASAVYNGYIYLIGGWAGGSNFTTVNYAPLSAAGAVGAWNTTTPLGTGVRNLSAVAYGGYMYVMGGFTTVGVTTVQFNTINSNGTLGATWTNAANQLTNATYGATAVAYNGFMYFIGGNATGSNTANVYYSAISTSTGDLGTWTLSGNSILAATIYASSVAYNGYLYEIGGQNPSTAATVNYAAINSNGSLGTWASTTSLTTATYAGTAVAYNGYIYYIGGNTGSATTSVYYIAIGNTGGLAASWVANTSLTTATFSSATQVYNGFVYEIGGDTGSVTANVYSAFINNGGPGTVGAWTTSTVLPAANYSATSVAYNGYIYEIGGSTTSYTNAVYYAHLATNGAVGTWTATTPIPVAQYGASSAVYNGYIYELGGYNGSYTSAVYYAAINLSDGSIGSWNTATSLPGASAFGTAATYNGYLYSNYWGAVYYAPIYANGSIGVWTTTATLYLATLEGSSVAYNGYVYIIGGYNGPAYATVQYAKINSADGSLGSWAPTTALPVVTIRANTVAYNGYLYEIGVGTSDYYAPINANGTVGNWTMTTSLAAGPQKATSVVYNGYVYFMGGSNVVVYAPLNVAPRVSHYSQLFNFGSLITPVSISYNGNLPNVNGLSSIQYRTAGSNAAFAASQYSTVLNGTSVACSTAGTIQYVQVAITLDDSMSSAFPDVSSTPANVTDFTVAYTTVHPAPNLRLRGGAFFSSNILQPLDTCALLPVPNAPTIGTATDAGSGRGYNNGSASVAFTPSGSGYAATSYTATSTTGGFTGTGTTSPVRVVGLQTGVAYTFTVTANNGIGSSNSSAASNSVTSTTVPQAPTIGTATDSGSGRAYNNGLATVTYTAGATGGYAATYAAYASSGGFTGTGASPISLTGLNTATAYTFMVIATNVNGSSLPSSYSNSITATSVPQAPSITSVSCSSITSASIAFTDNSNGGSAITGHSAISSPGSFTGTGASPITISGLTTGTPYTFTATATNANGTSLASTASSPFTPSLPVVTGGTLTSDATYYYRTFSTTGTLGITGCTLNVDALIIAGGGGGWNGGGGAGGLLYAPSQALAVPSYTTTVGGGGGSSANGVNSSFNSMVAIGGGASSQYVPQNGNAGGSGGGGYSTGIGGAGTAGQGYAGGSGGSTGAGGGGAGGLGANGTGTGGAGGPGSNAYSTWATVTGTGVGGYYAGGGGGWYAGTGGAGGGGAYGVAGSVNTGGGGGANMAGGSGIIIIRYTRASVGG